MAETAQDMLKSAWLGGRTGNLSAWSEAKLWAAREVLRHEKDSEHGLQTFAAGLVPPLLSKRPALSPEPQKRLGKTCKAFFPSRWAPPFPP